MRKRTPKPHQNCLFNSLRPLALLSALHMDLRNPKSISLYSSGSCLISAEKCDLSEYLFIHYAPNSLPFSRSFSPSLSLSQYSGTHQMLGTTTPGLQCMHNHSSNPVNNAWDWHRVLWFLTFSLTHTHCSFFFFLLKRLQQLHLIKMIQWGKEKGSWIMEEGRWVRWSDWGFEAGASDTCLIERWLKCQKGSKKIERVFKKVKRKERERESNCLVQCKGLNRDL